MRHFIYLFFFLSVFVTTAHARINVPVEAFSFDFNIDTSRLSRYKEEKIFKTTELLQVIFTSQEFKDRILEHRYKGRRRFARNEGLSNLKIYKKILQGMETLHPVENNAMDIELAMYTDNDSIVLGYTNPFTKKIWMNTKYFNRNSASDVAATLMHEWLHKLGFGHEKERTPDRKYTVPYAIGYIVRDIARKLNEDNR